MVLDTNSVFEMFRTLKNVSIMYLLRKLILHEVPGRESYQRATSIVLSPSLTILPIGPWDSYL